MVTDYIYRLIKKYDVITIFGHTYPDGDCYGSQIGLREAIKTTFPGKKVFALGTGMPFLFNRLSPMDTATDEQIAQSLAIVVDVSNTVRIEDQRFQTAKAIVKIDHHIPLESFGHIEWIETEALAACEMVSNFVFDQKMKISRLGAEALCLGIITDSGRFQYGNTTERTFKTMGRLMGKGVELPSLFDVLYSTSIQEFRFRGYIMANFSITPHGVAYVSIPKEALQTYGIDAHKAAVMVNTLANLRGCPIWAILAEGPDKVYVEMRSKGFSVQPIAVKYQGGGHANASGCYVKTLADGAPVLQDLDDLISSGGNENVGKGA